MKRFHWGVMVLICLWLLAGLASAQTDSWRECHANAVALYQAGAWELAYQQAKKAVATARGEHGEFHVNTVKSLNLMSEICCARGCTPQGVLLQKKVLKIQNRLCGVNHPNVVSSLTALGNLYRSDGKPTQAEVWYCEALGRAKKGGWCSSACTVPALEGLAGLYVQQGKLADAAELFGKALNMRELRRKYSPAEDLGIAGDLVCLADINRDQKNYAEASKLYRRALAKYRATEGPGSPMYANTLKSLGELYAQWKKPARAIACLKRAVASYEKTGLRDGPMMGSTLITLASIYRNQKRIAQAEALYKRATAIYERNSGIDKALASRLLRNARIWPATEKEGI